MTPEERSLLEKMVTLTEENNQILLQMKRTARIGLGLRITYWVLIILISVGAIYAIKPVFGTLFDVYGGADLHNVQQATDGLKDLLK